MSGHYVLRNGEPVAVDLMTWALEFEHGDHCILQQTYLDYDGTLLATVDTLASAPRHYAIMVSTVFLGLDHNHYNHWDGGPQVSRP